MRSKKVIGGREVGGTDTLLEHIEAYADDFGGESDVLRPGNSVSWAKNSKRTHTQRGPTRVSQRTDCKECYGRHRFPDSKRGVARFAIRSQKCSAGKTAISMID